MTDPTEALFCVKPDGHSGPHAGWIGGEWSVRDNWTDLRHPPIEQASVRPADPAEAVEVCPSCGGEGQRADGSLCLGCQGFGSIEQAAEAADREADYQRFLYPKGGPLTQWAAQTLAPHNPSAAVAPLDVERLREQVYYLLFIYGQMDAEHGHWAAVRRMLNIDAAYADAIRKRGGA